MAKNIGSKGTQWEGLPYYSYGASDDGLASTSGTSSAFGAKFDGQMFYQYDPEKKAVLMWLLLGEPTKTTTQDCSRLVIR